MLVPRKLVPDISPGRAVAGGCHSSDTRLSAITAGIISIVKNILHNSTGDIICHRTIIQFGRQTAAVDLKQYERGSARTALISTDSIVTECVNISPL
jgi:hypothetical protein